MIKGKSSMTQRWLLRWMVIDAIAHAMYQIIINNYKQMNLNKRDK